MKLTIQLVTWNGEHFIPYVIDSLRKQSFQDWSLRILDNGSSDETLTALAYACDGMKNDVELIEKEENTGFVGGHNELFVSRPEEAEYVMLINQDLYLQEDCLAQLVTFLDNRTTCGVVSPRLMRWNTAKLLDDDADADLMFSDYVDSLGLKLHRNRRVTELASHGAWTGEYEGQRNALKVFGVSGTAPMLRASAAREVAYNDGLLFDPHYHSYKEDIDLMYRLQGAGHEAYTLLSSYAHHARSAAQSAGSSDFAAAENKKTQAEHIKVESYKNHVLNMKKHVTRYDWMRDGLFILLYELKKFVWLHLFDGKTVSAVAKYSSAHQASIADHVTQARKMRSVDNKEYRKRLFV